MLNYTFDLGYVDKWNEIKITVVDWNDNEKWYYLSNNNIQCLISSVHTWFTGHSKMLECRICQIDDKWENLVQLN